MTQFSVSRAAQVFQVSRPTLQRAIKSGKISAITEIKDGVTYNMLDASELARYWKMRDGETVSDDTAIQPLSSIETKDLAGALKVEIEALKAALAEEAKGRAVAEAVLAERTAALEHERQRNADLVKLLPAPDAPMKRKWFWQR